MIETSSKLISIRVNDKVEKQFDIVTQSGNFSKEIKQLIKEFITETKENKEEVVLLLSECNPFDVENNIRKSIRIKEELYEEFLRQCRYINISVNDCIRKLILLKIKRSLALVEPNQEYTTIDKKVSKNNKVKMNLWLSKEDAISFLELYEKETKENILTVAINDLITNTISEFTNNTQEVIRYLSEESGENCKGVLRKYNFSVPTNRYIEFINTCKKIGVRPSECIRKRIEVYIKSKKLIENE